MKIKLFEKYKQDESGDISEEYAKEIISKYIDKLNDDKTLQDVFDDYCEVFEIEQREWILGDIKNIISKLRKECFNIDTSDDYFLKKKAKKYNI